MSDLIATSLSIFYVIWFCISFGILMMACVTRLGSKKEGRLIAITSRFGMVPFLITLVPALIVIFSLYGW